MTSVRSSDIVSSLAGHDAGSLYLVVTTEGGFAQLCNGKTKRLRNPKRKSLRHLEKRGETALAGKLSDGSATDKDIRKALAVFKAEEEQTWQKMM